MQRNTTADSQNDFRPPPPPFSLVLALGYALWTGSATMLMAALGFWRMHGLLTVGILGMTGLATAATLWQLRPTTLNFWIWLRQHWLWLLPFAVLLLVTAAHASYYPFTGDDTLARYAYTARMLLQRGSLRGFYLDGYPLWLPMLLAMPLQFWPTAEWVGNLLTLGAALAAILATYGLGSEWFGRRAGWVAALVLASNMLYLRWSALTYLDVPSSLYFVLLAFTGHRWYQTGRWYWATLSGMLLGQAIWVKQAGFAALPPLGVLGLCLLWQQRRSWSGLHRSSLQGVSLLILAILAGGWWYVRNGWLLGWQAAVPDPGVFYTAQAQHGWLELLPFWSHASQWQQPSAALGLLGLFALPITLTRPQTRAGTAAALGWAYVYTLLWWLGFSYDARFLLTVLPFFALLTAAASQWVAARLPLNTHWAQGLILCVAGVLVAVTSYQARLGGLQQWLRAPRASYAERMTRAKDNLYPVVQFVRTHYSADTRILTMDGRQLYFLLDYPHITVSYPDFCKVPNTLASYDLFIVDSDSTWVYSGLGINADCLQQVLDDNQQTRLIYREGDSAVYAVEHEN